MSFVGTTIPSVPNLFFPTGTAQRYAARRYSRDAPASLPHALAEARGAAAAQFIGLSFATSCALNGVFVRAPLPRHLIPEPGRRARVAQ